MFRIDYFINSVTTSDNGTYTCTVTNPIGSDSETITVIVSKCFCYIVSPLCGHYVRITVCKQQICGKRIQENEGAVCLINLQ